MNRLTSIISVVVLGVGVTWQYPLFHVVPLKKVAAERLAASFHAAKFADEFWQGRLTPKFEAAADAATVLAALRDNPRQAREKFGRQVGVSRTAYFFLRGRGTILSIEKQGVAVALNADSRSADVMLSTSPVFGNAVRDATGLLLSADFPNSQHFNELANELNRLAEAHAVTRLKTDAKSGRTVEFVGCASITGDKFAAPLKVTPVSVVIE